MLEINSTILIQFVTFILLMIILNLLLYRPLRKVLQKRRDVVERDHFDANHMGREVERGISRYKELMEEARKKGKEEKEKLRQEGMVAQHKLLEETEEIVRKKKEDMRVQIERNVQDVKNEMGKYAQDLAKEITEKILGRAV